MKSKMSRYNKDPSPSSNLVGFTSMDYKSLPSSNSNSHMDYNSKLSRYSNDITMHSYMDYSTKSSKSSNNITMHSHMDYSTTSVNRSNNISMHSHMNYSSLSARSNNGTRMNYYSQSVNDYTKYVSDLSIRQQNSNIPLTSTWKDF